MNETKKASYFRIFIGSLVIAYLFSVHVGFIIPDSVANIVVFVVALILFVYLAMKDPLLRRVKHLQYKTLSVLSFLLPVSAVIFSVVFTDKAIGQAGSDAEQAGAAIGSALGSGIVIFIAFVVGLSLGIVFYLIGRRNK
jgi:hypothetical protein